MGEVTPPASGAPVVLQFNTSVGGGHHGSGGALRTAMSMRADLQSAGYGVISHGLIPRGTAGPGLDPTYRFFEIPNIYWPFDATPSRAQRMVWHVNDLRTHRRLAKRVLEGLEGSVAAVLSHNLRGWGYAPWWIAARLGVPCIQVLHDYGLMCVPGTLFRGGEICSGSCAECIPRQVASRAHWQGVAVVGVSGATVAAYHRRDLFRNASTFVSYPSRYFDGERTTRTGGTRKYRFGYLGRVDEAKGVDLLLEACRLSGHTVAIAGSTWGSTAARLRAEYADVSEWLGWMDPAEFLDMIEYLVVPSVWPEPFGRVVADAARRGVPVLVANRGGLVEAAQSSGVGYCVFEPTVENLAAVLAQPVLVPAGSSPGPTDTSIADVVKAVTSRQL